MRYVVLFCVGFSLSGCGFLGQEERWSVGQAEPQVVEAVAEVEEIPAPEIAIETRAPAPSGALGNTVASLGSPSETGLWLKTPLVAKTRPGVVRWQGKSASVTLIPIVGESGAGSRLSLQAMQTLGIPLTDLAEVQVSAD